MITSKNTWCEVLNGGCKLAIFPIGSLEQHGPHLPLETDTIIANAIAQKVGKSLGAFVLPCLPISCSQEHSDFPGTVWLRSATLAAVLHDIVVALYEQGLSHIAIINQHGGNHVIKPTVLELNKTYQDLKLSVHHATPITPAVRNILESLPEEEVHAGELETSLLEVLAPELVHFNQAVDFVPVEKYDFLEFLRMRRLSPTGVWGNSTRSSRTKGERLLEVIVNEVTSAVKSTMARLDETS